MNPKYPLLVLTACFGSHSLLANDTTFTGTTGVLSTPNAYTAAEGKLTYQYNSFGETPHKNTFDNTYNHIFTLGLHPRLEIGGRLTDYFNSRDEFNSNGTRKGKRDLSANLKFSLPKLSSALPDIALGAIDIAGEAVNFSSQYVVASKKLGKGTYSVGYAQGDNQEFNGLFANAEYDLTNNLSLLAEYASDKYNVGASYNFSSALGLPLSISAAVPVNRAAGENDDPMFGLSLSLPLDASKRRNRRAANKSLAFAQTTNDKTAFVQQLARYGLEDIRLGRSGSGNMILAFDNHVYNHSYIDAIGVAAGSAIKYLSGESQITIVLLDNKLPKLAVTLPLNALKTYFIQNSSRTKHALNRQLSIWYPKQTYLYSNNIQWITTHQKNKTRLEMVVQPSIKTAIGTEWGTGDYSLAARANLNIPLWTGGSVSVSADAPISNTGLFDDQNVFSTSKHKSGLNQVMIHQAIKPSAQSAAMISVGQMHIQSDDYYTAQLEGALTSASGNQRIYAKTARFEEVDSDTSSPKTTYLASVRQALPQYGASAEIAYGKFFEEDKGAKLKLTRHLGDTDITAYVNYIDKQDISGGLQLSFPLTPRRDYKKGAVVVRGNEHWSYRQGTTIKDPVVVGSNRIRTDMMLDPSPNNTLSKSYYESNKLTPGYLKANIGRLRESYLNLVGN